MKLVESNNEYIINDTEYFYNLDCPRYHPEKIKAYIPKFMPKISQGAPAPSKATISTSMFINAPASKPSPATTVNMQNYVTLTRPTNLSPSYYSTSKGGTMIKNQKHILKITNKDIRQMHFIEDK